MSYSDDVFRKDIIKELSRIATALENIDMKMTAKNSLNPEDAVVHVDDEPLKTRTFTDCVGCEHLYVSFDPILNKRVYKCVLHNEPINQITNCNLR